MVKMTKGGRKRDGFGYPEEEREEVEEGVRPLHLIAVVQQQQQQQQQQQHHHHQQ